MPLVNPKSTGTPTPESVEDRDEKIGIFAKLIKDMGFYHENRNRVFRRMGRKKLKRLQKSALVILIAKN